MTVAQIERETWLRCCEINSTPTCDATSVIQPIVLIMNKFFFYRNEIAYYYYCVFIPISFSWANNTFR
jgi:hypothetical protein